MQFHSSMFHSFKDQLYVSIRRCFIFSLLVFPFSVNAQQPTSTSRAIDSLSSLIQKDKEDTAKVTHLVLLSSAHRAGGDITSSRAEADAALELAEKLNNKIFIAKADNNSASVCYFMGVYPDALSYYLAALKICTEEKNNDGLATAYIGIGNVYKD
jgi:hypothetical protein